MKKNATFQNYHNRILLLTCLACLVIFLPLSAIQASTGSSSGSSHDTHSGGHKAPASSHGAPAAKGHAPEGEQHSGDFDMGETVMHHLVNTETHELPILSKTSHGWSWKEIPVSGLHFNLMGIDMKVSKPVLFMWLGGLLLVLAFAINFRGGKLMRNRFAHLLEVYILFIRDEVVYPNLGEKDGRKFLPFFLTLFFFILVLNLSGLIPFGHGATANVNVTAGLAIIALVVIQAAGVAKFGFFTHFRSALVPSGLPWPLLIIMIPIELVGIIAKPFALCIRLFANMVAGHAALIVLLLLIIVGKSFIIAPFPMVGVLFISVLELFVAHLQAFIFTILTTLFVSLTLHPSH